MNWQAVCSGWVGPVCRCGSAVRFVLLRQDRKDSRTARKGGLVLEERRCFSRGQAGSK